MASRTPFSISQGYVHAIVYTMNIPRKKHNKKISFFQWFLSDTEMLAIVGRKYGFFKKSEEYKNIVGKHSAALMPKLKAEAGSSLLKTDKQGELTSVSIETGH